ncbi:MAG: NADPH:quinone oxidoreductase family protein [Myxococcales bacterium]|nr:NADPH:quinone oxidoreductase family protein [Myxococcales bacterium]
MDDARAAKARVIALRMILITSGSIQDGVGSTRCYHRAMQPHTGKRVVVSAYGETPLQALDEHVTLEDQPRPDPATLRAGDVIIAIRSAAVGWVDLLMTSGQYQHMPEPPYTPGLEYAGVVDHVGDAVEGVAVGDEVLVDALAVGPRSSTEYRGYGGFAHYAVAPADALMPLPRGLSFDQACSFLGSYETAYHCLVARGRVQSGETVLIHGASGATGMAAVQVAKICGARVIATGRSDDKLAVVEAYGADHVINSKDTPRFRDAVKALTDGRGVDVVYDGVGGDISLESLRCVRFGARFLIVGWAATPFVAKGRGQRGAPNANMLPTNLIMMKGLDVLGCPTVIATGRDPSIRPPRLAALLRWCEEGLIKPHVSHTFDLDDYDEAMRAKWRGDVIGGCVLHPRRVSEGDVR